MTNDDRLKDLEQWLESERDGSDDIAETAFARTLRRLPRVEPRADFADRVVMLTSQLERPTPPARWIWLAASVLLGAVALAGSYLAFVGAGARMSEALAAIVSRSVVWGATMASTSLQWWTLYARVAATMSVALETPETTLALFAIEVLGMLAFVGLKHLLTERPSVENLV